MHNIASLIESHGPQGFYHRVCSLLNEGRLSVDDFSYRSLAEACGVLGELRRVSDPAAGTAGPAGLLRESGPGVGTDLFRVVTGELIGRKVIEGYDNQDGFIGERLVTTLPSRLRDQKLAGFTALAGPTEVAEGEAYEESRFSEKYVTTSESKQGRILSINEEVIQFDQSGEINRRAMGLGRQLRLERERTIVRAVADATQSVYRPSGVPTPLYADDGSRRNVIGPLNTTSVGFDEPIPLTDWTAVDRVLHFRATEVQDDRIDGQPRPIVAPARQLLVPEALRGAAHSIVNATEVAATSGDGSRSFETRLANPLAGQLEVLSSPFLDELAAETGSLLDAADWFVGDFSRQFLWTEIWPVQTFLQRADSAAAFDRDVVLRVKARYFGGVSAVDTAYVTKVRGEA